MAVDPFIRKICAVGIGNILEWYDFVCFGALADIIGQNFFPSSLKGASLMGFLSLLSSAFLVRPIGGYLMGYMGDNYGRKKALEVSVIIMMIPSFLLGCIPSYSQISIFGTVLLCILRLLQGLAVGGEMVGALVFTIEIADSGNRGLWGGAVKATGLLGTVLGLAHVSYLNHVLTEEQMLEWGWRIPFLTSLLIGMLGMYLRSNLQETDEFTNSIAQLLTNKKSSLLQVLQFHWVEIILVCAVTSFWCVGYYTCFIWLGYYMKSFKYEEESGQAMNYAGELSIIMTLILIILMPCAGMLGDYTQHRFGDTDNGYRRVLMIGCAITTVFGAPAFALINHRKLWSAALGQLVFVISISIYGGNLPALIVEQFTVRHRYSGLGIAYNLANALFAGTAPLVQTYLVAKSTSLDNKQGISSLLPAVYLCLVSIISLCVLFWAPPIISKRRVELDKKLYHMKNVRRDIYDHSIAHFDDVSSRTISLDDSMDRSTTPMIIQLSSELKALSPPPKRSEDSTSIVDGPHHIYSSIHAGWISKVASFLNIELSRPPQPKERSLRDVIEGIPSHGKKTFLSGPEERMSENVLERRLSLSMNVVPTERSKSML